MIVILDQSEWKITVLLLLYQFCLDFFKAGLFQKKTIYVKTQSFLFS